MAHDHEIVETRWMGKVPTCARVSCEQNDEHQAEIKLKRGNMFQQGTMASLTEGFASVFHSGDQTH